MRTCLLPVMALLATSLLPVEAQNTVRVSSPRIYVFENGFIRGFDTKMFNLAREEVKEAGLVDASYLMRRHLGGALSTKLPAQAAE